MKKDACEHCGKIISVHDEGVLHGVVDISENIYKRKTSASCSSWFRNLYAGKKERHAEVEEGCWCDGVCLMAWIKDKLWDSKEAK